LLHYFSNNCIAGAGDANQTVNVSMFAWIGMRIVDMLGVNRQCKMSRLPRYFWPCISHQASGLKLWKYFD
jgi:hypothetical protein